MFIVSLLFSPSPIIPLRPLQSPGISKEELAEMERQDHETLAEIERQVSEVLYIIQLIGTAVVHFMACNAFDQLSVLIMFSE